MTIKRERKGQKWFKSGQNGIKWVRIRQQKVKNGQKCNKKAQEWTKVGSKCPKQVQKWEQVS